MKIIAYSYSEPLLELPPDTSIWGEVERVYEDFGERTQLQQLLRDCRNNPPEYLLIRQIEELGDSVKEIRERLKEIESLGIQIIFLYNQQLNTSKPERAELLKLLEEIQQNQRSRSIRKGHARNRLKNLPPPGKAPYGYRRGKERYTIDRVQAPIIKDFFEHFLLYGSLRGAVRYLEKKHGKKISVSTARKWLTNPVYRGDLEYQNGEVISNTHTPIISREEAAQIERILRRNQRLPTRSASAPRSLAGLVICSECKSLLTVSRVTAYRKKGEYLYLRPSNCPRQPKCKAIPYEQVLHRAIEAICRDLPPAVAGLNLPNIDVVKNEIIQAIATKKEILSQLPSLQATGILDPETADLRAYKLRTEISQLQSRLAEMPPVNLRETSQAVSLPQFWLDLSESERRFYFREFLSQIEIIRQDDTWQVRLIFIF